MPDAGLERGNFQPCTSDGEGSLDKEFFLPGN